MGVKILDMPSASSLAGADTLPVIQGGVNKHATLSQITAALTASDLLAKIETVDGTGSGLDADTLDGQHASDFAPASAASGAAKAWCNFDGSLSGTHAPTAGFNVTSVTNNGDGTYNLIHPGGVFTTAVRVVAGSVRRTDANASLVMQTGNTTTLTKILVGTPSPGTGWNSAPEVSVILYGA